MTSSRPEYNRVRPLLGTYLKIALKHEVYDDLNLKIDEAFEEAQRLENIFSKFDAESNLNFINNTAVNEFVNVEPELYSLLKEAVQIWKDSSHAFNPFNKMHFDQSPIEFGRTTRIRKKIDFTLDLNGIAKGAIVDYIAQKLEPLQISGYVNAGGDIRFFNTETRKLDIRIGPLDSPLTREIQIAQNSIATSIPRHLDNIRPGITNEHNVTVISNCCRVADALTKIYLYGDKADIEHCCRKYFSQVLVFSPSGDLIESVSAN